MEKETYWSRFADDFEERNDYVVGKRDLNLVKKAISEEKELGKTLELGCGNGTYSRIIYPNTDQLVITDFSDEMVAATKKRLSNFKDIEIRKENCHQLTFPKQSFDTVFMANLLHIIPEPKKAIAECKRVLKRNGKLIIVSFTLEKMGFFNKLGMMDRYMKTYGKPPTTSYSLNTKNAQEIIGENGLRIESINFIGKKVKSIFIKASKN